ncbi:MAG: VanZ family protein [Acidobacteria bacterium]|nr:VanZ family protein [Acidobacteriota bacterium]
MRIAFLWGPVVACMATIFWLSGRSVLPAASWLPWPLGADWMQHGVAFGVLALLILRALSHASLSRVTRGVIVAAWVITVLYGVSDEFHQSFVPLRSPDPLDVRSDAIGAALALGAAWAWSKIRRSP